MSRRYRKAMEAYALWWHEQPGRPESQYLPTEPAPMLVFSGDSKFILFLTIRANQFELVLDDIGVASIPSRQILGPINTPYMDIMGRVVGTTEWYAGENRQAGHWQRALWYYAAVSSFAAAFKDREAGRRIAYIRYQIAEEGTVDDPAAAYGHLSGISQQFRLLGDGPWSLAAHLAAGRAARLASLTSDETYRECAIQEFQVAVMVAERDGYQQAAAEARSALAGLGAESQG